MNNIVIIPARYDSTRFHGKVLAKESGKYLVEHTYEQVLKAELVTAVYIATDSEKVLAACEEFEGNCLMTSARHKSGTDRIAEAAAKLNAELIINVQADEPEVLPRDIDLLIKTMRDNPDIPMGTLVTGISDKNQMLNPNIVKAVLDKQGRAIYFSRSSIPFSRENGCGNSDLAYRHLGIYAYRKDFLLKFTKLKQTPLEISESLEQLRAVENGFSIITAKAQHCAEGIDTEIQYKAFVDRVIKENN